MLFQANTVLNCNENLAMETYLYQVNYLKKDVVFVNTYKALPSIFGIIMTDINRDSVGLRSFSPTLNGNSFLIQEDECFDKETVHTSNEQVAIIIIGQVANIGTTTCGMMFIQGALTNPPSASPSVFPSSAEPSSSMPSSSTPSSAAPSSVVPSAKRLFIMRSNSTYLAMLDLFRLH